MSSFALLNAEGVIERKLQLVSVPNDYRVPAGMILSWQTTIPVIRRISTDKNNTLSSIPLLAHFTLGTASAQVRCLRVQVNDPCVSVCYNVARDLQITVQGTDPQEIRKLRGYILALAQSDEGCWDAENNITSHRLGRLRMWWRKWWYNTEK